MYLYSCDVFSRREAGTGLPCAGVVGGSASPHHRTVTGEGVSPPLLSVGPGSTSSGALWPGSRLACVGAAVLVFYTFITRGPSPRYATVRSRCPCTPGPRSRRRWLRPAHRQSMRWSMPCLTESVTTPAHTRSLNHQASLSLHSRGSAQAQTLHMKNRTCAPLPHIVRLNRVPRRCNQQETAHFAASHAHARALSTRNYRVRHSNTSRVLHQSATPPLSCCCLALLPFRMRHCHGACPPRAAHSKRPCAVLCCHCFRSSAFFVVVCL